MRAGSCSARLPLALAGCDDDVVQRAGGRRPASAAPAASAAAERARLAAGPRGASSRRPSSPKPSAAATRSARTRGSSPRKRKGRVKSQRQVLLAEFSVDDLKLIGIVTRLEPARAMLVDPTGKGHVVRRGDFVGRADVVQIAGATGATYELNWRLDRIRDGDVVLVREDPNNPDVPAATKVIPLEARGRRGHGARSEASSADSSPAPKSCSASCVGCAGTDTLRATGAPMTDKFSLRLSRAASLSCSARRSLPTPAFAAGCALEKSDARRRSSEVSDAETRIVVRFTEHADVHGAPRAAEARASSSTCRTRRSQARRRRSPIASASSAA